MGLRDYHSFTVPTTDFLPPVFLAPTDTMVFTKAALLLLAGLGTTFVSAGVNTVTLKAAFGDMKGQYKNREGNPTTYYLHENDKENDQKYIVISLSTPLGQRHAPVFFVIVAALTSGTVVMELHPLPVLRQLTGHQMTRSYPSYRAARVMRFSIGVHLQAPKAPSGARFLLLGLRISSARF